MKVQKLELVTVDGVGSEVLDTIENAVNYEMSGDGTLLLEIEYIPKGYKVKDIIEQTFPGYAGLVLLIK